MYTWRICMYNYVYMYIYVYYVFMYTSLSYLELPASHWIGQSGDLFIPQLHRDADDGHADRSGQRRVLQQLLSKV